MPTPDSRITLLITEPRVSSRQRERRLAPSTICVAFSERAASTSACADVGADDLVVRAAELLDERALRARAASADGAASPSCGRTCTATRSPFARCAMRAARRTSRSPSGGAGERDEHALARLPGLARSRGARRYSASASSTRSATQSERELAQRGEVARPEVVARAPRRSAPPGRCSPCASRRRSASRRQVDELDLVGAAHDLVGDRLPLL